jgi:hypothetical protein
VRRCGALGASGSTKCHTLQNVELILSSAYYSGKLLRSVRRTLETRGSNAIVKRLIKKKKKKMLYAFK